MTDQSTATVRQHSNSYDIFILVLTVMSLAIMVLLLLPLAPAELEALRFYDNLICVIFLVDFAMNLAGSHPRSEYFVRRRGWIDLLGSIPSLGIIPALGLLRLFRLFRLARIARLLQGQKKKELIEDILHNRSQYATFITVLLAMLVLVSSSLARAAVREPLAGRQHHDRRRRVVVVGGDHHDGGLRRLLPGHDARPNRGRLRDARRRRHHRCPREHPRQPAGLASAGEGRGDGRGRGRGG